MLDKLELCQRALGAHYDGEHHLRTAIINACRGAPELETALFRAASGKEQLFADLRASVETHINKTGSQQFLRTPQQLMQTAQQYMQAPGPDMTFVTTADGGYWVERKYLNGFRRGNLDGGSYRGNGVRREGRPAAGFDPPQRPRPALTGGKTAWKKKCFVCKKENCWSTNHTPEERAKTKTQYLQFCLDAPDDIATFIGKYEGADPSGPTQFFQAQNGPDESAGNDEAWYSDVFFADGGNCEQTAGYLADQSFIYAMTGEDVYNGSQNCSEPDQWIAVGRYNQEKFHGILPDTGAAHMSTAGLDQ